MASTACFLHTYAPSTTKSSTLRHPLLKPTQLICRAQKHNSADDCDSLLVSRRVALTALVGASAVGSRVSPADAAYGEAANVFGKPKTDTDFAKFTGDGYNVLIPSRWNPSREREFPGQVLRYEDNGDAVSNISVIVMDVGKTSIADYGSPEEFLGKFDYLLGKQAYSGNTQSEGGFDPSVVATANVLESGTRDVDGNKYYFVSVVTRTADGTEGGKHQLISATVKNRKLYICKAQAGDKRWFKGAKRFVESATNSFNVA